MHRCERLRWVRWIIESAVGHCRIDEWQSLRRAIAARSPMSWAHVNMLGEYDFSDEKLKDSIGILPPKPAA
ncbi:MAG: hypothetical protein OXI74_21325 [Rhodospirillaceae bacterium]|nr:hypothetical protein [Rhodospirillaceae bacterium]